MSVKCLEADRIGRAEFDEHKNLQEVRHGFLVDTVIQHGAKLSGLQDRVSSIEEVLETKKRAIAERKAKEAKTPSSLSKILQMANEKDKK